MKHPFLSNLSALTLIVVFPGCGVLQPIGGLGKAILGLPGAVIDGDGSSWHDPAASGDGHPSPFAPALEVEPPSTPGRSTEDALYAPLQLSD